MPVPETHTHAPGSRHPQTWHVRAWVQPGLVARREVFRVEEGMAEVGVISQTGTFTLFTSQPQPPQLSPQKPPHPLVPCS